jgi:hypothetical protein
MEHQMVLFREYSMIQHAMSIKEAESVKVVLLSTSKLGMQMFWFDLKKKRIQERRDACTWFILCNVDFWFVYEKSSGKRKWTLMCPRMSWVVRCIWGVWKMYTDYEEAGKGRKQSKRRSCGRRS